ncbi:MAG: sulfite oxidase [Ktedonobacteraceae bacterium]
MSARSTHPHLTVYQESPLNAGTPLKTLLCTFFTPQELFYIRTYGSYPVVNQEDYRLVVNGMVRQPLEFSLTDLLTRFVQHTIVATLVCAGSRRNELATVHPRPGEVLGSADPISTASWRGMRLSDILQIAGIEPEAHYAAFCGLDEVDEEGECVPFGSSIRLEKAMSAEVLLVYAMNDAPLTPEHGFPLRVLVPDYIAARSVKWVQTITLQSQPSTNYFQDRDYKLFPRDTTAETVNRTPGKKLEEVSLNSVICTPHDGETRKAGLISMQGYAITGEEAEITHIELSLDRGATWIPASIPEKTDRWAWCFWETTLELPPGTYEMRVRAWDTAEKTQPESLQPLWNFKGYANMPGIR